MTGGKIASVLVKQILGIICLILLCNLVSEPVGVGAFNPVPCLGNCSEFPDCNQACIKKGFPKGGFKTPIKSQPTASRRSPDREPDGKLHGRVGGCLAAEVGADRESNERR
ncbi:hypothetical protein V6N11_066003 [Hibiscus sabdariffa]|uniref:Uncharacterized protein n=1 Tax=Hibiscus sabdariffa TaxID=183260 RepID=A0ABR2NV16_9ROSI